LYSKDFFKIYYPENKTIAVGNLNTGGSGKTPLSEYLLQLLIDNNIEVSYVSRGYKRKTKGYYQASDEPNYLNIGDEAFQIHKKFPAVDVLLSENRKTALEQYGKNSKFKGVFVFDDAFQHRQLKCGLYILLTPCHKPYFNDYVLPAGNLRESKFNASRADIIIVTKCPEILDNDIKSKIAGKLKLQNNQIVLFTFIKYGKLYHAFNKHSLNMDVLTDSHIILFSGIADPGPITHFLKHKCKSLITIHYKDHKQFYSMNILRVTKAFNALETDKKFIITTEKDFSRIMNLKTEKLLENLPVYILPVKMEFHDNMQRVFNQKILDYVR